MAIVVRNTNYNGEVLEKILVLATTGNDLVEKGLIMVIPGVEKKISLPRIKTGKMSNVLLKSIYEVALSWRHRG